MSEDSLLGMQLDEYRLEALLGRGGMARVYRGLDLGLSRFVAIKVIDTPFRGDEEYVKRFKIEAQAIARLDHPHVVRLYRYGEVNGVLYMAMQFIEGADLGYVLESYRLDGEYIPASDALRLIKEACQALDYIHAHGIIHRDIKPSNIMLTADDGRAILTDFGLALRSEVGTRGEVFGSPHYIAPEQAVSSARAIPQSDLYALGVIIYEMFTGVLPFTAPEALDVAVMHMSSPVPPPREIRPELSPEVEEVILKALEKKPEDRYQSGRALALALERALRGQVAPSLPTHRSIPERVTIGLAANPLPPLPPLPAAVTPVQRVEEPEQQAAVVSAPETPLPAAAPEKYVPAAAPAASKNKELSTLLPGQSDKKTPPWLLWGAAALLGSCLLICVALGTTAWIASRGTPLAGIPARTATPTWEPIHTLGPAVAGTPRPIQGGEIRLKIWRCKDEGCLVIENVSSQSFSLDGLRLEGRETSLDATEWGVDRLQPGQCVKVVKDEEWADRLPETVLCKEVGSPLNRNKKERFWENTFTISYQGEEMAQCAKRAEVCEVTLPR